MPLTLTPLPGIPLIRQGDRLADIVLDSLAETNITLLDGTPIDVELDTGIVSTLRVTVSMEIEALIEQAKEAEAHLQEDGESPIHAIEEKETYESLTISRDRCFDFLFVDGKWV